MGSTSDIYIKEYATVNALEKGIESWMTRYNTWRPHEALGNLTPSAMYRPKHKPKPLIEMMQRAA